MAGFAAFIPYIVAAAGTLLQGASAKQAAESEASQLESIAGQTRAASQREMANRRRAARYAQSRAQALAAASGAGASDPSVVDLISDLEGEGEYGALAAMFEGEDRARGLEFGATLSRKQGQAAMSSSALKAGSTLLSGGSSWYDKYGGQGAPGNPGSAFTATGGVRNSVARGTALSDYQNKSGIYSARYA
jgi:hypothetical protein